MKSFHLARMLITGVSFWIEVVEEGWVLCCAFAGGTIGIDHRHFNCDPLLLGRVKYSMETRSLMYLYELMWLRSLGLMRKPRPPSVPRVLACVPTEVSVFIYLCFCLLDAQNVNVVVVTVCT